MLKLDYHREYQPAGDGRQHLFLRIELNGSRRDTYLVGIHKAEPIACGTLNA